MAGSDAGQVQEARATMFARLDEPNIGGGEANA
jgi:hypothetical protein